MNSTEFLTSGRLIILSICFGISSLLTAQPTVGGVTGSIFKLCDDPNSLQDPNGEPSNCEEGTVAATIEYCHQGYVTMAAYCVDLGPVTEIGDYVTWPDEIDGIPLPSLHLQYEYSPGQYLVSQPIVNWQYIDDVEFGHKRFEGRIDLNHYKLDDLECSPYDTDPEIYDMNIKIVTPSQIGGLWTYYPVLNFADPDQIFSCDVFEETIPYCIDDHYEIEELDYDIEICADCEGCNPDRPKEIDAQASRLANNTQSSKAALNLLQNPFSSTLDFEYNAVKDGSVQLAIIDVNGKKVYRSRAKVHTGENEFSLQNLELETGMYFLEIIENEERSIERVVKLN